MWKNFLCWWYGHEEFPDCDRLYCTRCHKWKVGEEWMYVP